MKRKIIFTLLLLLTPLNFVFAEANYSRETNINIDKSGNTKLEIILKANTEFFDKYNKTRDDLFNLDTYNISLQTKGYTVDYLYSNDGSGITINKEFPSILEVSSKKKNIVDLSDITSDKYNDSSLFQIKKGLFSNKYIGNFIFDYSKIKNTDDVSLDEIINIVTSKLTIVTPYKAKSNNAIEISTDNKTLSWNLRIGYKNEITFEYEEINIIPIIIFSVLGILSILLLIIIFVKFIYTKIIEMNDLKIEKVNLPKTKKIKKSKKNNINDNNEVNDSIDVFDNNINIQNNIETNNLNNYSNNTIDNVSIDNTNKITQPINTTNTQQNDIFSKKPINAPNNIPESPDYTGVFNPKIDDFKDNDKD